MEDTRSLARRLLPERPKRPLSRHQGVVQAVAATTVSLTLDGGSTVLSGVRYLASYTPAVNDTVEVLVDGTDLFVLGKLA